MSDVRRIVVKMNVLFLGDLVMNKERKLLFEAKTGRA